ncbi:uncharacterized protein HMPREF1541_09736 [Cyphellophora europaea CBS 101466]|uniref:Altered inheritance of mitochondria protein 6 n=1 Tax=Cyphellophora europaea (strain CBS 101466) TaxID=1220924 RepID=W2S843_CYPE1|nr:uncharacterized protein HMPREF1541_09736 [Cyphellophora europaea CBS 101466]ETN44861.1 hypothetical protein HMPREF1541_09736 [Cyphellophora europaea CBS 101466]
MSPQSSPLTSSRQSRQSTQSAVQTLPEAVPFLHDTSFSSSPDLSPSDSDLENGAIHHAHEDEYLLNGHSPRPSTTWRFPNLKQIYISTRRLSSGALEKPPRRRPTLLRRVLRLVALLLMLLGFLNLITAIVGLTISFFPEEVSFPHYSMSEHLPDGTTSWPTDTTADIQPIACVSHNDYWRKEPLFSALSVGCSGVEADVWLYNDDLFVGHTVASLSTNRTLRSLYINPLLEILDKQNPTTEFHPSLDKPRNGVYDTAPRQTLILLIDFKTDGEALWPHVEAQLEPLRTKKYLSYFNGTDVIDGPITVVVTGNAPWNRVVANPSYRDMFFDAPLDLMANIVDDEANDSSSSSTSSTIQDLSSYPDDNNNDDDDKANPNPVATQGQGRSGAAPLNPAIYTRANSYYASVSFKRAVLGFPIPIQYPWRSTLTDKQLSLIRAQIRGAHQQGLKVRYWSVPAWPKGLQEYLWRVLVREGADYLNVDDLKAAKEGNWARDWEKGVGGWRWTGWFLDKHRNH